jgi:regulator of protease activity HflC (stomatin/prohibitin superfamily)
LKRVSFSVAPQEAFTKDNVKVRLGGDIIVRVVDPKAAAYGADSPLPQALAAYTRSTEALKETCKSNEIGKNS